MGYLRRDEDRPDTAPVRLLLRQTRELVADVGRAFRSWGPRTGGSLSRAMLVYHSSLALGRNRRSRTRTVILPRDGRTVRCLYRSDLSDLFVLREVFVQQVYRFPYRRRLGTVDRVLDIGSNAGFSPLYFSLLFPGAAVACVEPVDDCVAMVRRNRDANGFDWRVDRAAVASAAGR